MSANIKILYVTAGFFGNNAVSSRSQVLVRALLDEGFSVDVLTSCKARDFSISDFDGVDFIKIGSGLTVDKKNKIFRFLTEIILGLFFSIKIFLIRKKHSLVIITSPPFFSVAICAFFCSLFRLVYVVDVRDRYPSVLIDLGVIRENSRLHKILKRVEQRLYRKAKALVCVTEMQIDNISRDYSISPLLVRNGFDKNLYDNKEIIYCRTIFEPSESKVKIVCHGLFGQMFDELTFLELAERSELLLPNIQFILAGYGPKIQCIKQAQRHNIDFRGHLDPQQIVNLLQEADLGLSIHIQSAREIFPVKLFEFIGARLPMIVFPRNSAGVEVESKGMGWAYDPVDIDECLNLLSRICSYRKEVLGSCKEAISAHRSLYSRQTESLKFLELVRSLH